MDGLSYLSPDSDFSSPYFKIACIARQAAENALKIRLEKRLVITKKQDNTPVTNADIESHHIISSGLKEHFPNIPIISEEEEDKKYLENMRLAILNNEVKEYFLIDPIDGTHSFIRNRNDFFVNIALIENKKAALGVMLSAPKKRIAIGGTKIKKSLIISENKNEELPYLHKKSDNAGVADVKLITNLKDTLIPAEDICKNIEKINITTKKSVEGPVKMLYIPRGKGQLYIRKSKMGLWDIAAGHAITLPLGGNLLTLQQNTETSGSAKIWTEHLYPFNNDKKQWLSSNPFVCAPNWLLDTLFNVQPSPL